MNPTAWQPLSFTALYIPSQAISGIQGERSCSRKEQGAGWAAEESRARQALGLGSPPAFGFEANAARPFLFVKSSEQERHPARENWQG